ncbi:hypothetical protein CHU98_g6613 [Xylaria longipes]|nr:hypothetical protein CHU98_g6613 [Xylaria longipes]
MVMNTVQSCHDQRHTSMDTRLYSTAQHSTKWNPAVLRRPAAASRAAGTRRVATPRDHPSICTLSGVHHVRRVVAVPSRETRLQLASMGSLPQHLAPRPKTPKRAELCVYESPAPNSVDNTVQQPTMQVYVLRHRRRVQHHATPLQMSTALSLSLYPSPVNTSTRQDIRHLGASSHMIGAIQPDISAILVPCEDMQHVADRLWRWYTAATEPA